MTSPYTPPLTPEYSIEAMLQEDVAGYESDRTEPYNVLHSPGNTPARPPVRRRLIFDSDENDSDVEILSHVQRAPEEDDVSTRHRLSTHTFFYTQQERRLLMRQLRRHSLEEDSPEEPRGWAYVTEVDRLTVRRDAAAVGLDDYLFNRYYLPVSATYERVCEILMPNRRMTRSMARVLGDGLFPIGEDGHPRR